MTSKRFRATALVVSTDSELVLLVRDNGKLDYSMPGGGFKKGESSIQAAIREINEEIGGLSILSVERLRFCDFDGKRAKHRVCRLFVSGDPYIRQRHEIDKVVWWDALTPLFTQGHVRYILSRMNQNRNSDGLVNQQKA